MNWTFVVIWNYFLAIIPLILSFLLIKKYAKPWGTLSSSTKISTVLIFGLWFFLFPNIPYLFTGLRHISDICIPYRGAFACNEFPEAIMGVFLYVYIGIIIYFVSLDFVRSFIEKLFSRKIAIIFIIIYLPICALGILLGQIERFNSWNLVHEPFSIVISSLEYFTLDRVFELISYSISLYIVYFCIFFMKKIATNR